MFGWLLFCKERNKQNNASFTLYEILTHNIMITITNLLCLKSKILYTHTHRKKWKTA